MRILRIIFLLAAVSSLRVARSTAQTTELEDCLGPGTLSCSYGEGTLLDSLCGQRFYVHLGIVAWPAMRNVGPITIELQTRTIPLITVYPLFVQIVQRHDTGCTFGAGRVVHTAYGLNQCGGTKEVIGPVDLTQFNIPPGGLYSISIAFFESLPRGRRNISVGLSCIRVTSQPTTVVSTRWDLVKALYRE
jgi:hypothetical protein